MKIIGSQRRETLKEAGYMFLYRLRPGSVVLFNYHTGKKEVWHANDHHAGYTIQVGRWGYEFAYSQP